MMIIRFTAVMLFGLIMPLTVMAQTAGTQSKDKPKARWSRLARELDDSFFNTDEAVRIGENLLFYQHETGGWPKNIRMQEPVTPQRRAWVERAKGEERYATIDNNATTTEMEYLARLYKATQDGRYMDALLRAYAYLFKAQYANGGWPQFYPLSEGYYTHITYNDNAMVNVLKVLRDTWMRKSPFDIVPDSVREASERAMWKGVDCILATQVVQDGKPTVWCAQHDEDTFQPANARAYELVSLSGAESDGIVLFLMSLPKPTQAMKDCIENAIAWFKKSMITNLRIETFTDKDGKRDYRTVECDGSDAPCDTLWARFYTVDGNRPFFCDRDGVKRYDISEIGYERRNGYSWYNSDGLEVLREYAEWKQTKGR